MTRRNFLALGGLLLVDLLLPRSAFGRSRRSRLLDVEVTAYCPCRICCGRHANGITAVGRDAQLPGVAVDPSVIRLGSHLDIPRYPRGPNKNGSWIRADDTGSAIKGHIIDVRFRTHEEAVQWGRRTLQVRVWD